jgi:ketosteroid isomerase-like protein
MRHAAILVVALALGACPRSKSDDTTPVRPETPKEVIAGARGTIEKWRQAYQVRSFETLSSLYAHGNDLVVVQDGQQLVGWSSVEAMIKDRIERFPKITIRLKDIQVASLGPTAATATAGMTREVGDDTTTVTESGALTVVLRKDGDAWVIVAEHYSHKKGGG